MNHTFRRVILAVCVSLSPIQLTSMAFADPPSQKSSATNSSSSKSAKIGTSTKRKKLNQGAASIAANNAITPGFPDIQQLMQQVAQGKPGFGSNVATPQDFSGVLNVNGKEIRTDNPAESARLQQEMMGGFVGIPSINMAKAAGSAFQGAMNINGQTFKTDDPAEFQRLQIQFGNLFQAMPQMNAGNSNSASSFSGMINNNGNVQTFSDPAAFQQAQKQLHPLP